MLAVHGGRIVTVASLVDELWLDEPPRSAVANVRTYAANLRRTFETHRGPALSRLAGGYRLEPTNESMDLVVFEYLVEAAASAWASGEIDAADRLLTRSEHVWRGPLVAGLQVGPILSARRAALDEQHMSAIELWARVDLCLGRIRSAIAALTDHIVAHPYREQAHALLARARYADDDPAGALAAIHRAESALAEHLGIEPGGELQALRQRIMDREPISLLPEPSASRPGPSGPTPHRARRGETLVREGRMAGNHLPRPVVDFVGRRQLAARLMAETEAASQHTSPVCVIDGMAGGGKTAFAVHLAYQLASRHPDAQLFVDLRGHSGGVPLESADALTVLLRQLGVPAGRIPTDHVRRAELWERELGYRRAVIVLDNAASRDQVRALLPAAPGSVVLVTSRRRLSTADVGPPVSLPVLTADEAVQLLARTAGQNRIEREPEAAVEVVRRCGHLPLAVRLARGHLAHRPSWRVADLAHRLSVSGTVLRQLAVEQQTVASAFAASYEPLDEPVKRLFRLVSVHPGAHFDVAMAAALANLPFDPVEAMLNDLLDQHLIEEIEPGRYRLHDLMRQYSAELSQAPDEARDRGEAAHRLLDHVLHESAGRAEQLESSALRAHVRLDPPRRPDLLGRSDPPDVEWLERERSNLVALIEFAERGSLHSYAWRLARSMWRFCYIRGYFDDILVTHGFDLAAAEKNGDRAAQAVMHNYLASACTRTGSYLDSLRHLEAAVFISRELGDHFNEHRYRANLVVVHWLTGNLAQAVDLRQQLLRERPGGAAVESILALANLGIALANMGRYEEAIRAHRMHLFMARCRGSQYDISNALGHIAAVENQLGHFAKAVRLITASLRIRDRTGHRFGEAEARNDLGIAYRHLGRLDAAREQHELALELAVDSGERHVQSAVWNDLATTLAVIGSTDGAMAAHRRALELATRIAHPYEQGRALVALADHLDDESDEALRYRRRALAIFGRIGAPERWDLARRLAGDDTADRAGARSSGTG
ncbi:AfsR/SARP family transcriptional regulator [Micromonospora sp. CB01531]|uniref:AfsR/SARP family transcriptional regulator n=1 Tax=Micromonospora sp. CB01531 TaxID=1718947 RepID=UPI0013018270|nr:BTAD domain-containing putative transcriptional regulator [Micromonospora sp. CB01531]